MKYSKIPDLTYQNEMLSIGRPEVSSVFETSSVVPSSCSIEEVAIMHGCLRDANVKGLFMELGTYRATTAVGLGMVPGVTVITSDNLWGVIRAGRHIPGVAYFYEAKSRVDEFQDRSSVIQMICDHQQLIDLPLEYIGAFVDGNHGYQPTLSNLENIAWRIVDSGFLFIHDYKQESDPDVVQAVDEFLSRDEESYQHIIKAGSLLGFKKVERR